MGSQERGEGTPVRGERTDGKITITDGPYVQGSVNGVPVRFTMDTGASQTVISRGGYTAISENSRPETDKVNVLVDTNSKPIDEAGKAEFSLPLGPLEIEQDVIDADVEEDALLGYDVLRGKGNGSADTCILLSQGQVALEGNEQPLLRGEEITTLQELKTQKGVKSQQSRAPQEVVRWSQVGVLRSVRHKRLNVDPYGECHEPLVRPNGQTKGVSLTDRKSRICSLGKVSPAEMSPAETGDATCRDRRCHLQRPETPPAETEDATCRDQRFHLQRPEMPPAETEDATCRDQRFHLQRPEMPPAETRDVACRDRRRRLQRPETPPAETAVAACRDRRRRLQRLLSPPAETEDATCIDWRHRLQRLETPPAGTGDAACRDRRRRLQRPNETDQHTNEKGKAHIH